MPVDAAVRGCANACSVRRPGNRRDRGGLIVEVVENPTVLDDDEHATAASCSPGVAVIEILGCQSVSINGDGGFLFAGNELATAVQHAIPTVQILVNDSGYGNTRLDQELNYGGRLLGTELRNPDLVKYAESFGSNLGLPAGPRSPQARSKRSRFITLAQAAAKSVANFSLPSSQPYTSAMARSWELDPNTRSAAVAVQRSSPVSRSRPS